MIFDAFTLGDIELKNRMVMAPMTRCRAEGNTPNELMVRYYAQRATAGLIITEGTAPSKNGLGYARMPGIFTDAQVAGWKRISDAVHDNGGKIFMQLMHTGRVSHPFNMLPGAEIVAPSAVPLSGQLYTERAGKQDFPIAREMRVSDIKQAVEEFATAAKNAIAAGMDGVELHAANGYLPEQFLNPASNKRTDSYGGNVENRCRFVVEVAERVANAIGGHRTGIRISPFGTYKDMAPDYDSVYETNTYLARELRRIGLVYMHIVDHSSDGFPEVPERIKSEIAAAFGGVMIASGGLDLEKANKTLESGKGDLVAFARAFLANPDLVYRFKNGLALNNIDRKTFYTRGDKGYTDYAFANAELEKSLIF